MSLRANFAESDVDLELDFEFLPFFDLDPLPDVRQLPHTLDAISEQIIVPDGFIFGDKLVTRAFVSSYITYMHNYEEFTIITRGASVATGYIVGSLPGLCVCLSVCVF